VDVDQAANAPADRQLESCGCVCRSEYRVDERREHLDELRQATGEHAVRRPLAARQVGVLQGSQSQVLDPQPIDEALGELVI
jgi:hypothetical protein